LARMIPPSGGADLEVNVLRASVMAALAVFLPAQALAAAPRVVIDYTPVFDRGCSEAVKSPTPAGAPEEIASRLPEFRRAWDASGPRLLSTAQALTGKPLGFRETVAALHVCRGIASVSLPLAINMNWFLRATGGRYVEHPEMFVDTLFHELLHNYVRHILGGGEEASRNSALLRKHAGEPLVTRNHLHLIALQSAVYTRLGRPDMVAAAKAADLTVGPPYARAWELVEREGPDAYLAELRSARPRTP
jgi:hypothetical protein